MIEQAHPIFLILLVISVVMKTLSLGAFILSCLRRTRKAPIPTDQQSEPENYAALPLAD